MKKIILSLLFLLVLVNCIKKEADQKEKTENVVQEITEIDGKLLQNRNDIYFMPNEQNPFTGISIEKYKSGQIESKSNYVNGKLQGDYISYYSNGQVEIKCNFKDNKFNGERIEYYENGQIKAKENYSDGVIQDGAIYYHENGQVGDQKSVIKPRF